jgi:hypothetical protein
METGSGDYSRIIFPFIHKVKHMSLEWTVNTDICFFLKNSLILIFWDLPRKIASVSYHIILIRYIELLSNMMDHPKYNCWFLFLTSWMFPLNTIFLLVILIMLFSIRELFRSTLSFLPVSLFPFLCLLLFFSTVFFSFSHSLFIQ